jgi:hypothetical protein
MTHGQSFPASFGRSLSQRLDRLGGTLASLREQMRDGVAHAVGVAAADAVRAVARAMFGAGAKSSPAPVPAWSPAPRSALWEVPEDVHNEDRFASFDGEEEDIDDQLDPKPQPASTSHAPVRGALALGCEGAAWWLRRGVGNSYVLATLGVGLICTVAAYLFGSRLTGSLLSLAALADTLRSGTALLARIGPS